MISPKSGARPIGPLFTEMDGPRRAKEGQANSQVDEKSPGMLHRIKNQEEVLAESEIYYQTSESAKPLLQRK